MIRAHVLTFSAILLVMEAAVGAASATDSTINESYLPCPATPVPPTSPGVYPWCFALASNAKNLSIEAIGNTTVSQSGVMATSHVDLINRENTALATLVVISACYEDTNISRCVNIGSTWYNATVPPATKRSFPFNFGGDKTAPEWLHPSTAASVYILTWPASSSPQNQTLPGTDSYQAYLLLATVVSSFAAIVMAILLVKRRVSSAPHLPPLISLAPMSVSGMKRNSY